MASRIEALKAALEARDFFPLAIAEICRAAAETGSLRGYFDGHRYTVSGSLAFDAADERALYAAFGEIQVL